MVHGKEKKMTGWPVGYTEGSFLLLWFLRSQWESALTQGTDCEKGVLESFAQMGPSPHKCIATTLRRSVHPS